MKWQKNIIKADKKALNNVKTDRTRYITSFAYLGLARTEKSRFDRIRLSLPLKRSLKKKKSAMQSSVRYYGNASKYKIYEAATEATYSLLLSIKILVSLCLNLTDQLNSMLKNWTSMKYYWKIRRFRLKTNQ
jgi:hypothetical protein